jgi:hypothetical protein
MLSYVKYSPNPFAGSAEIAFKGDLSEVSFAIIQLGSLLTDRGWNIIRLWTPSVTCVYNLAPYIGDLFRPYTMYHDNVAIGYYNPATGIPDPPPGPMEGISIHWFEAPATMAETIQHTANNIATVYPGWVGEVTTPIYGGLFEIQVSRPSGGPFFNNQAFAPDPTWGLGGSTTGGGYTVRSKSYAGYTCEIDLFTISSVSSLNLYIRVNFGDNSNTYLYRLGRYNWKCFAGPHQLVMFAEDGTGETGDVAGYAKGFLITLPKIHSSIVTPPDYCGVACGSFWDGITLYNGGDILFHDNQQTSKIRLNDEYSPGSLPYLDFDTGLQFMVMYHDKDLLLSIGDDTDSVPLTNPAYLAVSSHPSDLYSITKVAGFLWDAFVTTQYLPRGAEITLDGHTWVCVASQQSSNLRSTATSLCVLK